MEPNVVIGFAILALIAWPLGVVVSRVYGRWRYRRPGIARIPGKPPARLMSPLEWGSVGAALILLALRDFLPALQPPPLPAPGVIPSPARPAANGPALPATSPDAGLAPSGGQKAQSTTSPAEAQPPVGDLTEKAAEERRWCDQGDRMMALGQHSMAAQAYWEAIRVQPRSGRDHSGLARARRAIASQREREQTAGPDEAGPGLRTGGSSEGAGELPETSASREASPGGGRGASGWNHSEDAGFHRTEGDRLLAEGMANAAITEYQKAIESDPSDVHAREGLDRARRMAAEGRR